MTDTSAAGAFIGFLYLAVTLFAAVVYLCGYIYRSRINCPACGHSAQKHGWKCHVPLGGHKAITVNGVELLIDCVDDCPCHIDREFIVEDYRNRHKAFAYVPGGGYQPKPGNGGADFKEPPPVQTTPPPPPTRYDMTVSYRP